MSTVVVTGAAGYIGGQIALQLNDAGHTVVGIDRRPLPRHLAGTMSFLQADFDSDVAKQRMLDVRPDAVVHCAGTSLVGPSLKKPSDYYRNNVAKTLNLLDFMINAFPKTKFIFSSSAAVYGTPVMVPCNEVDPCEPISPYGESKLAIEWILRAYHRAYGLNYVAFRYFNACGADSQARHGQEPNATHIIARLLESAKNNTEFVCNGNDYETADGTCVRDYVHVEDIADAHILALNNSVQGVYNIGSSQGYSNQEIISAAESVVGKQIPVVYGPRREGDPAMLTAESDNFKAAAGWQPKYNINDIIQHAWNWYNV
jgi:UDP-glucose 4-epimerase